MKLLSKLKFWIEDILYVYITWLLEVTLKKKIMLTKTAFRYIWQRLPSQKLASLCEH